MKIANHLFLFFVLYYYCMAATRQIRQIKNTLPEVNIDTDMSEDSEGMTPEDRLLSFVNEQIMKMRRYSDLGGGQVGFFELNRALSEFSSISCSMIALDVLSKEEFQKAQNEFDQFVAEKYMEAREILNPVSLTASKWASSKEIENYIMVHWKDEYWRLKKERDACEKKVAFCRRMLDNLDSYRFNLSTLSKNVQTEVLGLNTGNV